MKSSESPASGESPESSEPQGDSLIEMASASKSSKKPEKAHTEKTQEQLREALEMRIVSSAGSIETDLDSFDSMEENGEFEDKQGEEEGTGDKRKELAKSKIETAIDRVDKMKKLLDSKTELPQSAPQIEATYTYTNPQTNKVERQETITLDIEKKTEEFLAFYQKTGLDLPPDFEETIQDIWERNSTEIQEAIEQNGFDGILLLPGNIPLPELSEKMKMGKGYYTGSNFDEGGGFAGAKSSNTNKPRLILYHRMTLPEIYAKTGLNVHLNILGSEVEKLYQQNPNNFLSTLEDLLVMEKKTFEETGIHLSDYTKNSATWLPGTKSGARLVYSSWSPVSGKLYVGAGGLGYRNADLGARPSRSFF